MKVNLGLIVNPSAGLGGRVGLKGSDGDEIKKKALDLGARPEAEDKAALALEELLPFKDQINFFTASGTMGGCLLKKMGFQVQWEYKTSKAETTEQDTIEAARNIKDRVELILFAGGDGTARDIHRAIGINVPVIGIPAGVKIHSAVYANSVKQAGRAVMEYLYDKDKNRFEQAEVMDLDEDLYRKGQVRATLFGFLKVPVIGKWRQHPKAASTVAARDIQGMSYELKDRMKKLEEKNIVFLFGTGGTIYGVMENLGFNGSLLGVDIVEHGDVVKTDATEQEILQAIKGKEARIIVTPIGGQGHIFGRGNQQFSPEVLRTAGTKNIWIISTLDKILQLEGQSLYVDTSEDRLDKELSGYRRVIVGWQEEKVCRVLS